MRRGDLIRFIVDKRGDIPCDTTHWDPVIAYADGVKYQASAGFSTKRQGDNGWSYEMITGTETLPPVLRFLTPAFAADRISSRQPAGIWRKGCR